MVTDTTVAYFWTTRACRVPINNQYFDPRLYVVHFFCIKKNYYVEERTRGGIIHHCPYGHIHLHDSLRVMGIKMYLGL